MILTLLATYGLFEMQFQTKSIVWEENHQETQLEVYVNYVLELTPELTKAKKVEPVRKKLLAISFKPIDNNSPTREPTKEVVTEPIHLSKPILN